MRSQWEERQLRISHDCVTSDNHTYFKGNAYEASPLSGLTRIGRRERINVINVNFNAEVGQAGGELNGQILELKDQLPELKSKT